MDPYDDGGEGDPFSAGLGDESLFSGLGATYYGGLDDSDDGAPASPSASQFGALRLDAGPSGSGAAPGAVGAGADIDDDPFAALAAAIEEDKPK